MSNKTFEVKVPVYGYVTLHIEAADAQQAGEKGMEDCLNINTDLSEMENDCDQLELLPYEKLIEGNRSYVTESKLVVRELEDEEW